MHVLLWVCQTLLAVIFVVAGRMEATFAVSDIARIAPALVSLPVPLIRFIGIIELVGALGLIVPAATRIYPVLTPWAAVGLATIMVLAIGFHVMSGVTDVLWGNVAIGALAAFVAWGRFTIAPIQPRAWTSRHTYESE